MMNLRVDIINEAIEIAGNYEFNQIVGKSLQAIKLSDIIFNKKRRADNIEKYLQKRIVEDLILKDWIKLHKYLKPIEQESSREP